MAVSTIHEAGPPSQTSQQEAATTAPFTLHFTFTGWVTLRDYGNNRIQAHTMWEPRACFIATNKMHYGLFYFKHHLAIPSHAKQINTVDVDTLNLKIIFVDAVLQRFWSNFMASSEAVVSGNVVLDCIILKGVSNFVCLCKREGEIRSKLAI